MKSILRSAIPICALIAGLVWSTASLADETVDTESSSIVADGSRLAGDEKRTRFVVDLDRHLDFHVFALADPYRVVIDMPQTEFRLDETAGETGRGLVSAYRFGRFAPGKSRIVLDVTGPVEVDRAFALEPQDDQPARLVVDLVDTDRESMLAAINGPPDTGEATSQPDPHAHTAVPPGGGQAAETIAVVLDPGHGGIDPGAVSRSGVREKDVVLEFAQQLRSALEDTGRFEVHMTREDDIFVSLADRVRFAREQRASLFISIHADSVARGAVSGASVYTLSERASDAVAAELAAQENRSDALAGIDLSNGGDEVADILLDLVHRETKKHSTVFARTLVDYLRDEVSLVRNPLRAAGFRVLEAHDVPSVLVELGYLTSETDEQLLTDPDWQESVADRVTEAVMAYFGERHAQRP